MKSVRSIASQYKLATKANLLEAENYLSKVDPIIGDLIKKHGHCQLKPHTDYYGALVNSIIGQQLSVKAAQAIAGRFMDLFGGRLPTPKEIKSKSHDELRAVGLSNAKVGYIRDLAEKLLDGTLKLDKIKELSNDLLIEELVSVKGIGVWTSHMFLMFCVGRLDVLPVGDLGVKKGIQNLYNLSVLPSEEQITKLASDHQWSPYASVASWYIWRSLDNGK